MKHLLPAFLILLSIASCKKIEYYVPAKEKVILNVAYGTDPYQKMDVYLPEGRTASTTNVIVLLHGGAFIAGQKEDFSQQAAALMAAGYAVINVNYRLVDGEGLITLPATHKASNVKIVNQLDDIKRAVEFVDEKAREYLISSKNWAMAGHSAGGTLALLYAYGFKNSDGKIKAVANWAGVVDFSYEDDAIFTLLDPRLSELYYRIAGREPLNNNIEYFKNISPLWAAATAKNIPTLNIRPEFNSILGLPDFSENQYKAFTAVLNAKAIDNQFVEVKLVDHGFNGNWAPVLTATVAFFKTKM